MSTTLTYNGVVLENCLTLEFDQQPQRDDSQTDKWFDRFLITVKSTVAVSMLADRLHGLHGNRIAGDDVAAVMAAAQDRLGRDRCAFSYKMDDEVLVSANSAGVGNDSQDIDQDNGPKVRSLRIVHHSAATLAITFSIEVCRVLCTQNASPVIGNRWSCIDDVDENWRVTRHWRGKLRLSGKANPVRNPHDFRAFVIPPLQGGFRRQRMHFVAEPNMLELGYEITDVQMLGEASPAPALKMSATHAESFVNNGSKSIGEFNIRLDGPRGADKGRMIERMMQIATAKLAIRGSGNNVIVRQLMLVDHIGEDVNAVEARMTVERVADQQAVNAAQAARGIGTLSLGTLGQPLRMLNLPAYNPDRHRAPGEYGTATLVGLFACHLQTPCEEDHQMPQDEAAEPKGEQPDYGPGSDAARATYSIGKVDDGFATPGLNKDHTEAFWTFAKLTSRYVYNRHRLALAKGLPASGDRQKTAIVVRLAPDTCRRIVTIEAERVGDWPTGFRHEDFTDHNGIRHWLLDNQHAFAAPQFAADGRTVYSADFTYEYGLDRCPDDYDTPAVGFLPWDNRSGRVNDFPSSTSLVAPASERGLS